MGPWLGVTAALFKGSNMILCVLLVSSSRGCCLAAPGDHGGAARSWSCGVFKRWISYAHCPFQWQWQVLHNYDISVLQQVGMFFDGIANYKAPTTMLWWLIMTDWLADGWMDGLTDGGILGRTSGCMCVWVDGWIDGWMDGRRDTWPDVRLYECMGGWMDGLMDGRTEGHLAGRPDVCMYGWMDGLIDGRTEGHLAGRPDVCVYGWMDGWNGHLYSQACIIFNKSIL